MATQEWNRVYESFYGVIIYSTTLAGSDDTESLPLIRYNDVSVQCTGTFGAGVEIRGANHPTTPVYVLMQDALGNDLNFTANSPPIQILPGSFQIKAFAGGVTSVVVTVKARNMQ